MIGRLLLLLLLLSLLDGRASFEPSAPDRGRRLKARQLERNRFRWMDRWPVRREGTQRRANRIRRLDRQSHRQMTLDSYNSRRFFTDPIIHWFLLGFTEFYRVLPSFTESYRVLLRIEYYWEYAVGYLVLSSFT